MRMRIWTVGIWTVISSLNIIIIIIYLFSLSFFNLKTGRVVVAQGHSFRVKKVHSVVFSSDDTQVFTAAAQAEVLVWETATGEFAKTIANLKKKLC